MFAPGLTVSRMNVRSAFAGLDFASFNPQAFMKQVQRALYKQIQHRIRQEAFSSAAKKKLYSGFTIKVGLNSLTVHAKDSSFRALLEGQRKGQMRWLLKARGPIPIVLDTGELIFRTATAKSMDNGGWFHPGRKPTTVIEKAKEATRELMRKKAKEFLRKQLHASMRRGL